MNGGRGRLEGPDRLATRRGVAAEDGGGGLVGVVGVKGRSEREGVIEFWEEWAGQRDGGRKGGGIR